MDGDPTNPGDAGVAARPVTKKKGRVSGLGIGDLAFQSLEAFKARHKNKHCWTLIKDCAKFKDQYTARKNKGGKKGVADEGDLLKRPRGKTSSKADERRDASSIALQGTLKNMMSQNKEAAERRKLEMEEATKRMKLEMEEATKRRKLDIEEAAQLKKFEIEATMADTKAKEVALVFMSVDKTNMSPERKAWAFTRLELRCPRALDPRPSWTLGEVLTELDALEATRRATPPTPLKQQPEWASGGSARKKAFVMRIEEEDDTDEEDDNDNEAARALVTGARFSCNDLECSLSISPETDRLTSPKLKIAFGLSGNLQSIMNNRSLPHEFMHVMYSKAPFDTEVDYDNLVEEVRSKLSSLEVCHQNEIQRAISAFARLQKYAESRKEIDRRLDVQFQRKIAEVLDKHLSMVQRDHEQKSQIVERRIRDDAAVEEAKRREQSMKEEKIKQERARQEAEARQKATAKLAADAQKAAYEAAQKEAAEKEAAKSRAEAVSTSSQIPQNSVAHATMATSTEIKSELPANNGAVQQLAKCLFRTRNLACGIMQEASGHTRKDRVRNDDIRDRVGVAPIEEKLVQHRLRWFGHIQLRPSEAPVHSGRLKHADNVKRGRGRPNLTWEESVRRDLKDWSITKVLAMDRGIKIYADSSALEAESRRRTLHDQVPSNIYLSKEYSRYDRQIGKSISKLMPTTDSVKARASELIKALDGQDCPRPIACRLFADKMISIVKSRNPTDKTFGKLAFACGYVMLLVTNQVPDAMDYLLAEFNKVCMYTVPKHLHALNAQARNTDYFRLIGYQEEDGKLQSTEKYLVNVVAYVKLYAAMVQTEIKGVRHPHGLAEGWKWLAMFLNTLPAIPATAFALHAFLKVAGFALHKKYGSQFMKILDVISRHFIPALKAQGARRAVPRPAAAIENVLVKINIGSAWSYNYD
uniref:mRNA export factor GLE1 n=1 Tax=Aegilops tauschii TaxID=37682 RepID=M8D467_AEGTA